MNSVRTTTATDAVCIGLLAAGVVLFLLAAFGVAGLGAVTFVPLGLACFAAGELLAGLFS